MPFRKGTDTDRLLAEARKPYADKIMALEAENQSLRAKVMDLQTVIRRVYVISQDARDTFVRFPRT